MKKIFNTLLFVIGLAMSLGLNAQSVNYSVDMWDSLGDGWDSQYNPYNPSIIDVYVDGVLQFSNQGPVAGETVTAFFSAPDGAFVEVFYTDGQYDSEHYIEIKNLDTYGTIFPATSMGAFDGNDNQSTLVTSWNAVYVVPPPTCDYTVTLWDGFGDGWTGFPNHQLQIWVDGALFTSLTFSSGSEAVFTVPLQSGSDVEAVFVHGGIWAYECGYKMEDSFGNILFSYPAPPYPYLPNYNTNAFTVVCPLPCGVELLSDAPSSIVLDPGLCETTISIDYVTTGDCQGVLPQFAECFTLAFDFYNPSWTNNNPCGISGDECEFTLESLDHASYGGGGANTCTSFGTVFQWKALGDTEMTFDYSVVNDGLYDYVGYTTQHDWSSTLATLGTFAPYNQGTLNYGGPNAPADFVLLDNTDGASGTVTINVSEGDYFSLLVWDDSYFQNGNSIDPGAIHATFSNFSASWDELVYLPVGTEFQDFITVGIGEDQTIEYCTGNALAEEYCFTFEMDVYGYPNPITEIACNDHVIISLDQNCSATINADMILEGGPYGCYDLYTVVIEGMTGNVITEPGDYVVGVYDVDGNNCWSTITVLDKLPPSLECTDIVVACYEAVPYMEPVVSDNCFNWSLSYVDVVENFDCNAEFQAIIHRQWIVTDHNNGMTEFCIQNISITRATLDALVFPTNYDGLVSVGNFPMIECNESYSVDAYGNPSPDYTGWPAGTAQNCGTIEVFYNDVNYTSLCGPKILREWTVIDDCTSEIVTHTQIIRISDTTAPVLNPKSGIMNKSTSAWSCDADYAVPTPEHFYDACDANPYYWIEASAGIVWQDPSTGAWYVFNMPIGLHTITYIGSDWCGNTVEADLYVNVFDGIPPIAVCEQYKQTSLTFDGTGTSKIWAEDFDSGSHDAGCGPVYFKVLRNDLGCPEFNGDDKPGGGNDIWYDDFVKYCCADIGNEPVMTTLRVFDVDPGPGPIAPKRMEIGGDLYGHFNDCWTAVTVEEKVPPQMIVEDVDITCEQNWEPELNPTIPWPVVYSTCGNYDLSYTADLNGLNVCGYGKVVLTWTVSVNGEAKGSAKQNIFLSETTPFDPLTIVFPYITSKECLADPTGGEPTFETNPCNVVDAEIVNIDTFKFVDDACYKILIDWVVIDWCVYEPNTGAEMNVDQYRYISGNKRAILDPAKFDETDRDGYYKFTEVLMVYDLTPANIVVEDVCLGTATCVTAPEAYELSVTSYEDDADCGGIYEWIYVIHDMATWNVVQYSHNNAEYLAIGEGTKGKSSKDELYGADGSLTILPSLGKGQYRVLWTLKDGCSNTTQAYQYIEVADKKPPTPFLVDISTATMANCMVEIDARFFDKGACNDDCLASYDNCADVLYFTYTPVLPLIDNTWSLDAYGLFYFSPETGAKSNRNNYLSGSAHSWDPVMNTAGKVFNQDYIPATNVDVYVWDEFALNGECNDGNYDYATILLSFNTEGDDCGGNLVQVGGMISSNASGEGIDNVSIEITNASSTETQSTYTDAGAYAFNVYAGNYNVEPVKRDDYSNGVTTLDLVLIQKHLLGLVPLTGDNLIAADANASSSVSAADLFELRELILGVKSELAHNDSWVFLPGAQDIAANANMDVNFGGIKVGDVNGSAVANANSVSIEARSANTISLVADEASVEAGLVEVAFTAENFTNVFGAQFTLNVNGMTYAGVEAGALNVSDNNFGLVRNGVITMSWDNANGSTVAEGTVLFTLKLQSSVSGTLSNLVSVSSDVTAAQAYTTENLDINSLNVTFRGAEVATFELYQNEPNPFTESTVIGFSLPEAGNYTLTIFDVTGKVVKVVTNEGQKGYNQESIDRNDISTGVMYYQLESNDYNATKKMIIIE